jgi:hypothetical protein
MLLTHLVQERGLTSAQLERMHGMLAERLEEEEV